MARAATAAELALYRSDGKWSRLRAAILTPPIVYRARINQTFATYDQVLEIIYDSGSGTLSDVLPDMEVWIGSSLDAYDKGICRLRDKDATHFYLSETSEIAFANDDYVTVLAGFGIWARPVRLPSGIPVMDETVYSDQHTNWDPMPNMGADQVVELTGVTVETTFHAGTSFCPGSSIASYAWSCATASAASDPTLADFTVQFDTGGNHLVYLTVTGANGKTFFGVRNVFVVDNDHPAYSAAISNPGKCDVNSGGWEFELTLFGNVNLADVHERAKIILFSEDHYGNTTQAIGPVAGSENIWFIGWISRENNRLSAEQGSVTFIANGAAHWLSRIPSWPDGVEYTNNTPNWTTVNNLTVDLGVYHHLRWRSTLTRVMDVTLTGDTRISQEVSSSAQDLWGQLQEMTWNQIYARPGVNALNQLSIQIHPCLIPTASRTYPTVMAITKADYTDGLDFERALLDEVGIVDMSGVQVTAPGRGSAYFALAPGHSLPHYGDWDIQTNLLLASQAQVIALAGLYRSWRNNPFKQIPIPFDAPVRLIDCFPNQRCTISISAFDNIRGWAYSGGLIPTSVQLVQDPATGYCHIEVTFEAQTNESQSRVGDTPGSGDPSNPPVPSLPPIVIPPIVIPGLPEPTADGPSTVIVHDLTYGFIYCTDFNSGSPHWLQMNGNLNVQPYVGALYLYQSANWLLVCPNGVLYCGRKVYSSGSHNDEGQFIARAASVGQPWTIIFDYNGIAAEYPSDPGVGISIAGINTMQPEQIAWVMGNNPINFWMGSNGSYAKLAALSSSYFVPDHVSYGEGKWRVIGSKAALGVPAHYWLLGPSGASVTSSNDIANNPGNRDEVLPVGSTPIVFMDGIYKFVTNISDVSPVSIPDPSTVVGMDCDPSGFLLMGRYGGTKGKSPDGGSSWSALGSLPPSGGYLFAYAGPGEDAAHARFIATGSGAVIRYTDDFGTTWQNREGDITSIAPVPSINIVKVVGY